MTDHSFSDAHITSQTPILPAIRAWEIYLQDQDRSPYTIKAFSGDLQLFASYLPPDKTIGTVTTKDIENFLKWLEHGRGVPCSPKSLSRRITSIKSFFRWLQRGGFMPGDPAEKVVQKSVISPIPQVLDPQEEHDVLEAARTFLNAKKPDARPYTLLVLLLSTGIKKGECLAIDLNHIDIQDANDPYLFIRYSNPQYRYKERKISLPVSWIPYYQQYLEQYKPADTLFPWSPRRLEYLLEEIGQKAGIEKHLSFDMCRWTCALNDKRAGIESDKIRQKMGVSKIQWRELYNKLKRLSGEAV